MVIAPGRGDLETAPGEAIDPQEFRRCLGAFVTGVTVVTTTGEDGTAYGLTANSFSSLSLDPPLILWSLRCKATNYGIYRHATRFAVNILAEDQLEVANAFAVSGHSAFNRFATEQGIGGLPLIAGTAASLECRTEAAYPSGDHALFIGRVERIMHTPRRALAFRSGKYMVVHPYHLGEMVDDTSGIADLHSVQLAQPVADDLARNTGRAVGLAVFGNMGPTIIWWAAGSIPLEVGYRCGVVVPMLSSATGLVFAAYGQSDQVAPFLESEIQALARDKQGAEALDMRYEMERRIAEVRERGAATIEDSAMGSNGERRIIATSVPVFVKTGEIVLSLVIMGNADECEPMDQAVQQLVQAGAALSKRLGYGD